MPSNLTLILTLTLLEMERELFGDVARHCTVNRTTREAPSPRWDPAADQREEHFKWSMIDRKKSLIRRRHRFA